MLLGEGGDGEAAANEEVEEFAGALIPVYPAAAAVPTWVIARCVRVVLDTFTPPDDPLPATVRAGRNLVGLDAALREIHRPSSKEDAVPGPAPAEVGRGVRRPVDPGAAQAPGGRLAGAAPAARGPAGCWTRSTPGCRTS